MPKILDQKLLRPTASYTTSLDKNSTPPQETDQNMGFRGIVVSTKINSGDGGFSFVVAIIAVDAAGIDRTILSATYTSTGAKLLRVLPTLTASANVDAQDEIPRNFRVDITHADGKTINYSCAYSMLV